MTIYSLDVLLFLLGNQSVVPCSVLTVAAWPAYRFLKRQVRWSGIPIFFFFPEVFGLLFYFIFYLGYSQLFQDFPQFIVIHTVKGFGIVNKAEVKWSEVTQSCLTLCNLMDYSLPGSIHGIFQARLLEWVAISFSRRSSRPRDWTRVSQIGGRRFTVWATREVCLIPYLLSNMWHY